MTASARAVSCPRLRVVRAPRAHKPARELGVIAQVRLAARPEHRLAALVGAVLGGFVPVASFVLAHVEADRVAPWRSPVASLLVLGGLLYSAPTVYAWMRAAVGSRGKALGAVVLLEGILVASRTELLAYAALGILVAVNAVATGCRLAGGAK